MGIWGGREFCVFVDAELPALSVNFASGASAFGRMHKRLNRRRTPDRCRRIHAKAAARHRVCSLLLRVPRPWSSCACAGLVTPDNTRLSRGTAASTATAARPREATLLVASGSCELPGTGSGELLERRAETAAYARVDTGGASPLRKGAPTARYGISDRR